MTTIANMLDATKLSDLLSLALTTTMPADTAEPDPVVLVDAKCSDCGCALKVAEPVVGTIVCKDCGKARTRGKSGRRYVKTNHPVRTQATPEELAQAGGFDLSKMSDAEIGAAMRHSVLGMTVTHMTEAQHQPTLTRAQLRRAGALAEHLGLTRDQAVTIVLRQP